MRMESVTARKKFRKHSVDEKRRLRIARKKRNRKKSLKSKPEESTNGTAVDLQDKELKNIATSSWRRWRHELDQRKREANVVYDAKCPTENHKIRTIILSDLQDPQHLCLCWTRKLLSCQTATVSWDTCSSKGVLSSDNSSRCSSRSSCSI